MKIKNLSQQNLSLSLTKESGENIIVNVKPNQIFYCENNLKINKQLLIYEKKNLIYLNQMMDKPSYVDYYKCFFESGSYNNSNSSFVDFDEEDDEMDVPSFEIEDVSINLNEDDEFNEDGPSIKKGRGRPKGTSKPKESKPETNLENKKGRGRPKGSIKKVENLIESQSTEPKKGRGRPKGSIKKISSNPVNQNTELKIATGKRGRPRKQIPTIMQIESVDKIVKQRGRPRKNTLDTSTTSSPIANIKKRGRPRKNII